MPFVHNRMELSAYFYSSLSKHNVLEEKKSHRNICIRTATNRRRIKLARDKPHYAINPFCFYTQVISNIYKKSKITSEKKNTQFFSTNGSGNLVLHSLQSMYKIIIGLCVSKLGP